MILWVINFYNPILYGFRDPTTATEHLFAVFPPSVAAANDETVELIPGYNFIDYAASIVDETESERKALF